MRQVLVTLGLAVVLVAFAGCGARKPIVYGVVTLDGKVLDNGTIQFYPVAGDGQTAGAVLDKEGRYRVEISPTKMKVIISSSRVVRTHKRYEGVPDSPIDEERAEVLPPHYNDLKKTELTVDPHPGENEVNFELKSGKK
jgi:hypothetical protein